MDNCICFGVKMFHLKHICVESFITISNTTQRTITQAHVITKPLKPLNHNRLRTSSDDEVEDDAKKAEKIYFSSSLTLLWRKAHELMIFISY